MNKILILCAAVLICAGCASENNNVTAAPAAQDMAAVTDKELINVQAPAYDYESNVSYEDQLRAAGTYIRASRGGKDLDSAVR